MKQARLRWACVVLIAGILAGCQVETPGGRMSNEDAGALQKQQMEPKKSDREDEVLYPGVVSRAPSASSGSGVEHDRVRESGFKRVQSSPVSTFGVDVDTASYAYVKRVIEARQRVNPDAVRVEEMINYFGYGYAPPTDGQPVAVHVETGLAPWAQDRMIVKVGLKAREVSKAARPASNLVFLIDVSGSMDDAKKLPLAVASLKLLVSQLDGRDRVSIVTYANGVNVALEPTECSDKTPIYQALDRLRASGGTNGGGGLRQAYSMARGNYLARGVNRVVLMTDGDFNVGITDREELAQYVTDQAGKGVYLSIFGFGMDNLKDGRLEELSRRGNGNYGYIGSLSEAKRAFAEEGAATLNTVAKDVKVQVEFNPKYIAAYRLIGYENRALARQDFNNDLVDSGDMGAGQTVTAMYEVVTVGNDGAVPIGVTGAAVRAREIDDRLARMKRRVKDERMSDEELAQYNREVQRLELERSRIKGREGEEVPAPDPLKYQHEFRLEGEEGRLAEVMTVKVRYKAPDAPVRQGASHLIELPVEVSEQTLKRPMSEDLKFGCAVVEYAMVLRGSAYAGSANLRDALMLAREGQGEDKMGRRAEFIELIRKTRELIPDWPVEAVSSGTGM